MRMILTKAPALEPVSLVRAKAAAGPCTAADDTLLSCLLTAARVVLEARTGLVFLPQAWTLVCDHRSDGDAPALPFAPVREVTSTRLRDRAGGVARLAAARIRLATNGGSRCLRLDDEAVARFRRDGCHLEADVLAGLADRPADLPAPLRQAVCDLAVHWFTRRETVAFGDQHVPVPPEIAETLTPFAARVVH